MNVHPGGIAAILACAAMTSAAAPQQLPVTVDSLGQPAQAARAMPPLARQLLSAAVAQDRQTRVQLELVAGDTAGARRDLRALAAMPAVDLYRVLDNRDPFGSWQAALQTYKGRTALSTGEALTFVTAYAPEVPSTARLIKEDEERRFIIERRVSVPAGSGMMLAASVVRPRGSTSRVPAALDFTIYAQPDDDVIRATYAAARGYAGVYAYTRGKAWGTGRIVPYEDDGRDADRVITWISRQPWSNGSVGMYSGSYEGFTQWAAAKYANPALKTIVPYVANNPGNGLPMENNIFLLVNYPWIYYVTDNKYADDAAYAAPGFRGLNRRWFASGRPYRDVPQFTGRANPWLQKWLDHPSFDRYWQSMVPYESDFSRINIPVLTVSGYYDDGQGSALNFLKDHYAYNPHAVDYLVIGPYDHIGSQRAHKDDVLRGYAIDPVAQFSTPKLTFDWFDWIMRGGKKPAMLADRINYEVMGANVWRHAPSLAAMANREQRYYLVPRVLSPVPPRKPAFMPFYVNYADRKTVNGNDYYPAPIVGDTPDLKRGLVFKTAPLAHGMEIDGFFTARLQAIVNKRDFDVEAVLYQIFPNGTLMHLSYYMGRVSYGDHIDVRRLLTPGKVETIEFDRSRLFSRFVQKGSRLMLVLDAVKSPFAEINYGTGGDVSRESIRDAGAPLQILWSTRSYITLPVSSS